MYFSYSAAILVKKSNSLKGRSKPLPYAPVVYLDFLDNLIDYLLIEGKVPSFKIGDSWRLKKIETDRWISGQNKEDKI